MKKQTTGVMGLVLAGGAALILAGAPASTQGSFQNRLTDFGVPDGANVIAIQAKADGSLTTVVYEDARGDRVTLGGVVRQETPRPQ